MTLRDELDDLLTEWSKSHGAHWQMANIIREQTSREDCRQRGYAEMLTVCIRGLQEAIERGVSWEIAQEKKP